MQPSHFDYHSRGKSCTSWYCHLSHFDYHSRETPVPDDAAILLWLSQQSDSHDSRCSHPSLTITAEQLLCLTMQLSYSDYHSRATPVPSHTSILLWLSQQGNSCAWRCCHPTLTITAEQPPRLTMQLSYSWLTAEQLLCLPIHPSYSDYHSRATPVPDDAAILLWLSQLYRTIEEVGNSA